MKCPELISCLIENAFKKTNDFSPDSMNMKLGLKKSRWIYFRDAFMF